jgi:hypothetical protein
MQLLIIVVPKQSLLFFSYPDKCVILNGLHERIEYKTFFTQFKVYSGSRQKGLLCEHFHAVNVRTHVSLYCVFQLGCTASQPCTENCTFLKRSKNNLGMGCIALCPLCAPLSFVEGNITYVCAVDASAFF